MKRGNIQKFHRTMDRRDALHKALLTAVIEHKRIKTTESKGKVLVRLLSRLMKQAKKGTISAKRELSKSIGANAVSRLIELAPKVSDNGGYARIIRLGQRKSDGASMVFVEIILNS